MQPGCIDASEMPDTYGAPFDQTKGYVAGGWGKKLKCPKLMETWIIIMTMVIAVMWTIRCLGLVLSSISLDDFITDILPGLTRVDTVIVLLVCPRLQRRRELLLLLLLLLVGV